ncbi:MAG: Gfo/Idh/MocA family oxidoreductase [Verrucomicrobiota bacterium]
MSTPQNFSSAEAGKPIPRRQFLRYSAAGVGVALAAPAILSAQSPNSKLNIAVVGAGGKGSSDTDHCAGENIYALCDVDQNTLDARKKKYPDAQTFRDYRKMFDEIGKNIDAVIVATPDHHHALASVMAMKMGKAVYCQKPLVQTVQEARVMRQLSKEKKLATQMGNQGSAENGLRRAVEVVQAGVIGKVRQLHVWSNRPIWPQGVGRPEGEDPVPETLDWETWIGPAPMRPYKKKVYHDFAWRGWYDFGTGALGDMACHTVNMPFRALKLGFPSTIEARYSKLPNQDRGRANKETYPSAAEIRFEFPEREGLVPCTFTWYDGGLQPYSELTTEIIDLMDDVPISGCLLVGDKGKLFSPDDYGAKFFMKLNDEKELKPGDQHEAAKAVPEKIERNAFQGDADKRQHLEWIEACKTGKPTYSNFDIAAYLTEIILLGCVAMRVGKKLEWDGPAMVAKNSPEASNYVKRNYREGWNLNAS